MCPMPIFRLEVDRTLAPTRSNNNNEKHVLDHADRTAPTQHHELHHTDIPCNIYHGSGSRVQI